MKGKIIAILVMMLLIAAVALPVAGTMENSKINRTNIKDMLIIQPPPEEEWNKTFGGSNVDGGSSVRQTSDGGYILVGDITSYGAGAYDVWLIKTDSNGNKQWDKTFGGIEDERAHSVQQTTDGGYIIAGYTESFGTGDGHDDVWLIKTDASGNEQWNKTFGGEGPDAGYSVQQTTDGGYVVAGSTGETFFEKDCWLIKTDASGNEQWNKTLGGSELDTGVCVRQTTDGGYVTIGQTRSYGVEYDDVLLIKTDSNGNEQWHKTFGGSDNDTGSCVIQTTDGGYILLANKGFWLMDEGDIWLIKTDASGNKQWEKTMGGTESDFGGEVQQTTDGGYIIGGTTFSYGEANGDFWLIKTDASGNEKWNITFGGVQFDFSVSVQQTTDGGFITAGITLSFGAGLWDAWLIKLVGDNQPPDAPTIEGRKKGKVGNEYEYTFKAVDPDDNDIKYFIDWGDNNTELTDYHPSGEKVKVKHTWDKEGTYTIKSKARDIYGAEGPEGTLEVTMPKNKAIQTSQFLKWLQSHPNLFPILRLILIRFGLQ